MTNIRHEPVVAGSVIVAFIQALIIMGQEFQFIDWTAEQITAVMAVVVIVAGMVTRQYTRPWPDTRPPEDQP